MKPDLLVLAVLIALAAAACSPAPDAAEARTARSGAAGVVDSIFPIEEELRRFRAAVPAEPTMLAEVAESREALVARFAEALARADLPGLQALALDRAEFAYLYYPFTRYTHPPYELGPGLLWSQMQNRSSRGLTRALSRLGGAPWRYAGHSCNPLPELEGENTLWTNCEVELRMESGERFEGRLFGSILERDGRFKFVSYANAL